MTYWFRNTGSTLWGTSTNWSLSDGGPADGAVPTAADDANFSNLSGNCTLTSTAKVCKTLNFNNGTGYTGTFARATLGLTVSGSITYSAGMTLTASAAITMNASGTYTSNGIAEPYQLINSAAITITLGDNSTIFTLRSLANLVMNGNVLTIDGNSMYNAGTVTGTTSVVLTGSPQLRSGNTFGLDLTNNTAGTITIHSDGFRYGNSKTWTHTAGTVDTTGGALTISSSCTLNLSGITWNSIFVNIASTASITLTSVLTVTTLEWYMNSSVINTFAGTFGFVAGTLYLSGSLWSGKLTSGTTYTVNTNFYTYNFVTANRVLQSTVASSPAYLNLAVGATQNIGLINATDIDSSGGQPIWDWNGVLLRTVNWNTYTSPGAIGTVGSAFST